jgi:hypothetical protein
MDKNAEGEIGKKEEAGHHPGLLVVGDAWEDRFDAAALLRAAKAAKATRDAMGASTPKKMVWNVMNAAATTPKVKAQNVEYAATIPKVIIKAVKYSDMHSDVKYVVKYSE